MASPKISTAVSAIERHGILLVFPIKGRPEIRSLWSELHPRTTMRWEWSDDADDRVVQLWHLRERLARSRKVIYAKWFRGRATFFSRTVFRAMLQTLRASGDLLRGLGPDATELLELLEENSPQSTKALKKHATTWGRFVKPSDYDRALKHLWSRLLIVGVGEVDDGAFPSLSVGATSLLFEDLWLESETWSDEGESAMRAALEAAPHHARFFAKVREPIASTVARG